eukprot:6175175-Pleurochrysis_carterae.AAC.2
MSLPRTHPPTNPRPRISKRRRSLALRAACISATSACRPVRPTHNTHTEQLIQPLGPACAARLAACAARRSASLR